MSTAPGPLVLARVRAALDPAAPWVRETGGGFTWWPWACAQQVTAEPAPNPNAAPPWRVRVRTPLVRRVAGGAAAFAVLSDWNARHPGLAALVWDGEREDVALESAAYAVAADVDGAARWLASAALLHVADAVRDADALAQALLGERADAPAPDGRVRTEPDALAEAWRRFAAAPPPDAAERRAALERAAAMTPPPWRGVQVDASGLHAELSCDPAGSGAASSPGAGVALLHVLAEPPHPWLGAGWLVALRLPPEAEPVEGRAFATAALLAGGEAREWTGFDALGAWCVHPAAGLAHVAFLPALLDEPELLARVAWSAGRRARWAMGFLAAVAELRRGH